MSKWKDIGTLLLEFGLISRDDLEEGLRFQKETGLRLGEALAKLGKISMEDIDWVLSKQLDIPYVIVEDINVNVELLEKFPKEFLIGNRILPLYETEDQVSIVTEDPLNKSAISFVEKHLGKTVNVSAGSGKKIEYLLKLAFNKVVVPELTSAIEGVIERIKETSFYRIDFLLDDMSCNMNVFGFGILKNMLTLQGTFSREDIFKSFNSLSIPFLYDHLSAGGNSFIAVYPLVNKLEIASLPAIVGSYGLHLPDDTTFADARINELSHFFISDTPVYGYRYFLTKQSGIAYEKSVYTIDAVPDEFRDFYVNAYIPKKCSSCNGAGCGACKDLGYEFSKVEGMYSSDDLKKVLKEV